MTSLMKAEGIVYVIDDGPKSCACGSILFFTRPKSTDTFSTTYVDCVKCGEAHRIGGVWE